MGFSLSDLNPVKVIKNVVKTVTNPTKLTTAVLTGGASFIAPKVFAPVTQAVSTLYSPKLIAPALSILTGGKSAAVLPITQPNYGGQPMSFDVGQFLGNVSTVLGQSSIGAFQTVGQIAGLGQSFVPAYGNVGAGQQSGSATPVMQTVPSRTALTQDVFTAGSKMLTRLGIPFGASTGAFVSVLKRSLSSVASLARKTPAGTIVNLLIGLGLTAGEAYLLTVWHSQRKRGRRMNPANAKALRRAARRIKSFHKLCTHTDVLRTSRRGGSRSVVGIRSVRCGTCKKSPCKC